MAIGMCDVDAWLMDMVMKVQKGVAVTSDLKSDCMAISFIFSHAALAFRRSTRLRMGSSLMRERGR